MSTYNPKEYIPNSYFFVDHTKLKTASSTDTTAAADAFGPVSGNETTQYRTTSFVRATDTTTPVKVFSICDGQILIQPSVTAGKVNIILKPENCYAPLKIKYFVYRNVNKEDLLSSGTLIKDTTDSSFTSEHTAPRLLTDLWTSYTNFNGSKPDTFSASFIGYDESASTATTTLIDSYFTSTSSSFVLPYCCAGDHIGYFTEKIGLDVVLDNGDCKIIDSLAQLFKFDLAYARESEHVFNTATVAIDEVDPELKATKIKRYREYILQFLDSAAFWGSHINCGEICLTADSTTSKIKSVSDVYTNVLNKYQTASKQYIYITEGRGRSYGYYDASGSERTVSFETAITSTDTTCTTSYYVTNSWPIIINGITFETSVSEKTNVCSYLQYSINSNIINEKYIAIDMFAPDTDYLVSYPHKYEPDTTGSIATTDSIEYAIHVYNNANLCACFLMISCDLVQTYPLENYFNHLFPAGIIPVNYSTSDTDTYTKWSICDQNRMEYLLPVFDLSAKVYNKVVTDTQDGVKRCLFMAIIKENTKQTGTNACAQYQKLNVAPGISGYATVSDSDKYASTVYDDTDFAVYRGAFTDSALTTTDKTVYSLSLINTDDFEAKKSYFQLGITQDDYDNVMNNSSLPTGADNVFFYLLEIYTTDIQNSDYRKFKLGLTYEDCDGQIVAAPIYPTTDVYVYTMDGYYFFSAAYSLSQQYHSEFASVTVNFRPQLDVVKETIGYGFTSSSYNGEFGFDWLRVGDNNVTNSYQELPYAELIVNAYRPNFDNSINTNVGGADYVYTEPTLLNTTTVYNGVYDNFTDEENGYIGSNSYKVLLDEYNKIPTYFTNDISQVSQINGSNITGLVVKNKTAFSKTYCQYYIPYLNIFSENDSNIIYNKKTKKKIKSIPVYSATLRVVIKKSDNDVTNSVSYEYEFNYDDSIFSVGINPSPLSDSNSKSFEAGTVTISCCTSFDTNKQITVWAKNKSDGTKKLAGSILICANSASYQKTLDVLFVDVKLSSSNRGSHSDDDIKYLQKLLFQNFITANVVEYGTFKAYNYSHFIDTDQLGLVKSTTDASGNISYTVRADAIIDITNQPSSTFFDYLKTAFFSESSDNEKYRNYYLIFFFDALSFSNNNTEGLTEYVGYKNSVLFKNYSPDVVAHEVLHGLGLRHTHRDIQPDKTNQNLDVKTPLIKEQKYIYYEESTIFYPGTENVMSYNTISTNRSSTWKWQWDLLNEKFKKV